MPIGTRIDGATGSAELEVRGALGSLAFRTGSGDVAFDEISGDVQIVCASGDVSGDAIGGHLSYKGASGDLDIGSIARRRADPQRVGRPLDRRLDGTTTITIGSGDIELREVGAGSVKVRAISGDVQIGVREGMGIWMDVSSTRGDVHSGLDAAPRSEPTDAGPQLELIVNTVSGDVDISRVAAPRGSHASTPPRPLVPPAVGRSDAVGVRRPRDVPRPGGVGEGAHWLNAKAGLAILPFVLPSLFGPALGVYVDRFPRRRVMVATDLAAAACLLPCSRCTTRATSG